MKQELINEKDRIIYEDNIVFAYLVKEPAVKGQILLVPKKPAKSIEELNEDEVEHIFSLANICASSLFQTLGAQGTNIISSEEDGFSVTILTRNQDDGLDFLWKPKQISTTDMDSVAESISSKIILEDKPTNPPKMEDQPEDKLSDDEDKDNYLIKQLERIP